MDRKDRKVIAVCASWEDEENLNLFLNRLIAACEGTDYLPMCVTFTRNSIESRGAESLDEYMALLRIRNLGGLLVLGEMVRSDRINGRIIAYARERQVPVFMLERQYDGCINLVFQYADGFEKVARHLVEAHGCQEIVMVAGIRGNAFSEERISLLRQILEAHGGSLPPERVLYGDYWDEPTYRALDAYFLEGRKLPEAFICANDAMAIAVCTYLTERNIQVPDQVRVAGFDGILPGENHDPAITTAQPDFAGMYGRMLEKMDCWQTEETGKTEYWPIPFTFLCRESCGCGRRDLFSTTKKISELKIINLMFTRHIRAMGNFIRETLSMDSYDELAKRLRNLFSAWPNPYYFAGVRSEEDRGLIQPILHGVHGEFLEGTAFFWQEKQVPDGERLRADPSVRIVLAQLLQNEEETMGYLISGMQAWSLREQERFEEEALFLTSALNAIVGNRRLESANKAILRMAEHDYLTGMYNRRGFLRELERRLSLPENQNKTLTLFAVDMDGLKSVNDIYGHQEGDFAIQCLAKALMEETAGDGLCARYGGDEFAFAMLADESLKPRRREIRERIEKRAEGFRGEKRYPIAASVGACSCPVAGMRSLDQILAEADQALYADKKEHKKESRR